MQKEFHWACVPQEHVFRLLSLSLCMCVCVCKEYWSIHKEEICIQVLSAIKQRMCHQAYNRCLLKEGINIAWCSSHWWSCLILFNKQRRLIVFAQPFPKVPFFTGPCHSITLLLLDVLRTYLVLSILWLEYIHQKINCYESMDLQGNCCRNIDLQQLNIGSYSSQIADVINY